MTGWLHVTRGDAPLLVAFPHAGIELAGLDGSFKSAWLARLDTDWWIDRLYDFVVDLGATTVGTRISRSVIDVNRDPAGKSLYPGMATTGLCPETTFDGTALYVGPGPGPAEIAVRHKTWFEPYHAAIRNELARLRAIHPRVVLYDAHSIRSVVPHLFDGQLPQFNIGTNGGTTCDPALAAGTVAVCAAAEGDHVVDGRFRGGWTTRNYGQPHLGVHAIQMELAIRGYCSEPATMSESSWPPLYSDQQAGPMRTVLLEVMRACLDFAYNQYPGAIR